MRNKTLQYTTNLLLVIAAIYSVAIVLYVGRPDTFSLWVFGVLFSCLNIFPYLLVLVWNTWLTKKATQQLIIFVSSILIGLLALAAFYYGFFINRNGQNGLLLVIVPVLQIALAAVAGLATYLIRSR